MSIYPTLNIPNVLTIVRLLLVPVFVVLVAYEMFYAALAVFITAGITDALDGFIAKRFDQSTEFGTLMDPVADKFLLISAFIVLTIKGWMPPLLCTLVILRDMVIIVGFIMLASAEKRIDVVPAREGKITTTLQIITVIMAILAAGEPDPLFTGLVVVTAAATVYSGFYYVWREVGARKGRG
ncbi:MAG: CDP-alcohol phosphatidyltransferase family protein [Thermodesulfobacteriota bacterium]